MLILYFFCILSKNLHFKTLYFTILRVSNIFLSVWKMRKTLQYKLSTPKTCICPNFFVILHAVCVQSQQRKKKTENNNYGKEGIELERYDGEMAQ